MDDIPPFEILRLEGMLCSEKRLRQEGFCRIAGVDEAGRGPLAGPVVAAACILPEGALFRGLNDSKLLTAEKRDRLFSEITSCSHIVYGIGIVDERTIDRINILQATFLAMRQAVASMASPPDYLLIDGNQVPYFDIPAASLIQGDRLSLSIAAASILAKVTRDRLMEQLHLQFPQYGFNQHKGYATEQHLAAIHLHGPSPVHRTSFEPVKSLIHPKPSQIDLFP